MSNVGKLHVPELSQTDQQVMVEVVQSQCTPGTQFPNYMQQNFNLTYNIQHNWTHEEPKSSQ